MSAIFDEQNMMRILEEYIPAGETILAGVHGVGLDVRLRQVIGKCSFDGKYFSPSENGKNFLVNKEKHARFDLYFGITENYLLISQCERNEWFYEFLEMDTVVAEGIQHRISLDEVGARCFPLSDIESCVMKKIWMGAVNCKITLKGGILLKIQFPKLGGVGGGMPNHAKYREAILACLSNYTV